MKKLMAILVSVGMLFTTCAFANNIIIPNSAFNQSENSLAEWFMWLPMDTANHKTYHDLLKENFENTFQELITAFELNGIEGEKAEKIRKAYGLKGYITKIFYLDEIQQTFNAAYGTNINMASLDGYETIIVRDGYFITILYPHGTDARPVPIEGKNMEDNTQYWTWQYQDEWNTSDYIYTIITTKNVCGYNIRCIEYIGYSGLSSSWFKWYYSKIGENVNVFLDGEMLIFDQPPIIYNDRTLVPMRAIFEAMGCEVVWDDGVINVYKDDENIMTLWVNVREMWLPSGSVTLDVAPMVINDRTLVPVRAITESMGAKVEWDGDLKIVYISYSDTFSGTVPEQYM